VSACETRLRARRVPREVAELVERLREHTSLLREYSERAFADGDDRYLGEIAAKLRLLVYEHGRNRPLLIDLMEECGIDCPITLSGPAQFELAPGVFGGDQVSSGLARSPCVLHDDGVRRATTAHE
jgi:hypothetical protein